MLLRTEETRNHSRSLDSDSDEEDSGNTHDSLTQTSCCGVVIFLLTGFIKMSTVCSADDLSTSIDCNDSPRIRVGSVFAVYCLISRRVSSMSLILLIILILLLVCALPNFGYHSYGYAPSGLLGVVALVLIIMFLTGRL